MSSVLAERLADRVDAIIGVDTHTHIQQIRTGLYTKAGSALLGRRPGRSSRS
jgi:hypothetical protein